MIVDPNAKRCRCRGCIVRLQIGAVETAWRAILWRLVNPHFAAQLHFQRVEAFGPEGRLS